MPRRKASIYEKEKTVQLNGVVIEAFKECSDKTLA